MFNDSKIPYLQIIPVIGIAFILYKIINKIDMFLFTQINVLSIISPFIWAFAIAYLLNPIMVYLEKEIRIRRAFSISIIYIVVIGFITFGITIISPRIAKSIGQLIKEMPNYFDTTEGWLQVKIADFRVFDKYGVTSYIEQYLNSIISEVSASLNDFLSTAVFQIINVTSFFFKIILGLIISIYLLKDKDKFIKNIKRALFAIFSKNKAQEIIGFSTELHELFSKFIIGKFIDSCIIGVLCFIGLLIIKAPFALLFSIIVGITNMIPYFGPFIGMIPAVLITVFYSPIKALWILIFILLLQQFDGLYLGPKILGNSVGLSPFWIILAIIIGGGTFGLLGMFLAVPIMALIKTIFERYVNKRLESKDINI